MLAQLAARGFRNLEPLSWQLEDGAHLILGPNGAGKTSLLEAIYLIATTRSFRTSQLADCQRHDVGEGFHLSAEVTGRRRVQLELSFAERRSDRSVNGEQTSLAEHLAVLPVVCWTASQVAIFSGGPGERRRLIDRGVLGVKPTALDVISRYRRTLQEKRQLLARGGAALEPWNQLLAETASRLIALRSAQVEQLGKALSDVLDRSRLDLPAVVLRYRSSPACGIDGSAAIAAELDRLQQRERQQRQPLIGPHRDELEILWADQTMKRVASAGERKALGLALLIAQGKLLSAAGKEPVYLLDDADTELDEKRLQDLWIAFHPVGQLLATSNRPEVWKKIDFDHFWHCEQGRLRPLEQGSSAKSASP